MSGLSGRVVVGALLQLTSADTSQAAQNNIKLSRFVLDGLRLALKDQPNIILEEMDTAGDPGQVVKLVHEAAARPEVMVLVGPISSREALAAAQTAQTTNIPIILISQRLGVTVGRSMVFRIFFTPKHQAEAVARYAIRNMEISRLGALYPNDQYGQSMVGFFRDEVQRLGAQLGAVDAYNPGQSEYTEAVNRLTGGKSVRHASTSYQAPVDFEALYLPDSASTIAQILPLMAYNDVTKMLYLGSPLWLVPELAQNYGRYMQGAIIPAAISSLSERSQTVNFRESFERATGQPAEQFGAYGYDAGVALNRIFSAGAGNRAEIVRALQAIRPFEGATGPFSFNQEGDYQVDPMIITVDGNAFKLLAEPSEYR
jgi:ABC-type branched-subunit amino acid transport system substrate-binding protein